MHPSFTAVRRDYTASGFQRLRICSPLEKQQHRFTWQLQGSKGCLRLSSAAQQRKLEKLLIKSDPLAHVVKIERRLEQAGNLWCLHSPDSLKARPKWQIAESKMCYKHD